MWRRRNLLPGTMYRFNVRSKDRGGKRGPWSSGRVETRTEGNGTSSLRRPPSSLLVLSGPHGSAVGE